MQFEVENRAMFRPPETSTITAHGGTFAEALENPVDFKSELQERLAQLSGGVLGVFLGFLLALAHSIWRRHRAEQGI